MKSVKQTIKVENVISKDGKHRYSQSRIWDKAKPMVTVITIYPGESDINKQDLTTMLIVNNCVELGFGGVYLVNLFSELGLTSKNKKKFAGAYDEKSDEVIRQCCELSEKVIFSWGSIIKTSEVANQRAIELINLLDEFKERCFYLTSVEDKISHPLSPVIRNFWKLSGKC